MGSSTWINQVKTLSKKANAVVVLLQLSAKQTHAYWITTFESYSGAIRYEASLIGSCPCNCIYSGFYYCYQKTVPALDNKVYGAIYQGNETTPEAGASYIYITTWG